MWPLNFRQSAECASFWERGVTWRRRSLLSASIKQTNQICLSQFAKSRLPIGVWALLLKKMFSLLQCTWFSTAFVVFFSSPSAPLLTVFLWWKQFPTTISFDAIKIMSNPIRPPALCLAVLCCAVRCAAMLRSIWRQVKRNNVIQREKFKICILFQP